MKVRDGGHVPRAAGRGTCEKSAPVVDKVGYYRFDDLQGKPDSRGRGRHRSHRSVCGTHFPDSGLTSVPNSYGEQLDRCA